jgi:hypothetical protein
LFIISVIVYCHGPDIHAPDEKMSASLNIISGKNQSGENGERLEEPVVIRVTDGENNPLRNIQINCGIIDGGGTLDDDVYHSDNDGLIEIVWTLGYGSEHVMKASVTDTDYSGESVYVFAQTWVNIEFGWISDISFPRLFDRDIAHDNRILESNHYLIFSDESGDDAKVRFAKIAEETLYEVFQAFHIQSSEDVGIIESDRSTKPKLFSNVNTVFPYGGFAFNTGYVYYAIDSETYLRWPPHLKEIYRLDIKHETVHIIQFLVGLDNLPNLWPDVWFSEGLAVYISNNRPPIADMQELNEWRQIPGNDNPVKVHEWSDLPPGGRRYYHMFGLAVKYLLHEKGHGKTTTDVLNMYRHMHSSRDGFADAFQRYMGISLQYYEDNYWNLITDFLSGQNLGFVINSEEHSYDLMQTL